MEIRKDSLLYTGNLNYDYVDSFEYTIIDSKNKLDIQLATEILAKPAPKWFEWLFALRNRIASLFKLKTSANFVDDNSVRVGIFKVYDKTANEIILGEDDKHLDFRVSLRLDANPTDKNEKKITVTTIVKYNNWLGRTYFFFVKPFHRALVPRLFKRNAKQLESEINS